MFLRQQKIRSERADTVKADRKAMRQRVLRHQHDARIRFWRLFVVVSFFFVAIGANLYVGATVLIGNMCGPVVVEKSVPGDGRTARVRRPLFDGTFCRDIIFDKNRSRIKSSVATKACRRRATATARNSVGAIARLPDVPYRFS